MFWKESKGLNTVPKSSKIALTAFLILIGIAYIFGFANIYLAYSPIDKEAGLSIKDIKTAYYGSREETKLEKSIDGTMREYFESEEDYSSVKSWVSAGAAEKDFATAGEVFERSCIGCHSSDVEIAGVALETYEEVEPLLKQDTGKSVSRLVSLSHTHLFGVVPILFILTFIFSFTTFPEKFKQFIFSIAFFAAALDIGSWWLAKSSGELAFLILIAGSLLGISFVVLILLPLYEIWLKKKA